MQAAQVRATAIRSFTDALPAVESLLMRGGQRTARRNAGTSVLEARRRAKDRAETQRVLDQFTAVRPRPPARPPRARPLPRPHHPPRPGPTAPPRPAVAGGPAPSPPSPPV